MPNVLEILQNLGYRPKDLGNEYQMRPLYRESDNETALCVNKNTGLFHDFVTKESGTIEMLVEKTLNGNPNEEILKLLQFDPVQEKIKVELEQQTKFNKDLVLKLKRDFSYWEGRGIDKFTMSEFCGGIAQNGRLANRYVFSIYNPDNGDLVGFAGRYLKPSLYCPKWKLLSKKSLWVYPAYLNKEIIQKSKIVNLVESIADMLSLWSMGVKNTIVLFGTNISSSVICFLLKNDISKINIILNNDSEKNSVGNKAAQDIKKTLLNFFDEGQINNITIPYKDLNEMLVQNRGEFEEFCRLWNN